MNIEITSGKFKIDGTARILQRQREPTMTENVSEKLQLERLEHSVANIGAKSRAWAHALP